MLEGREGGANVCACLGFLDAPSLFKVASLSLAFNDFFHDPQFTEVALWRPLCEEYGYTASGATRTRGRRSWIEIFKSNVCIECHGREDEGSKDSNSRYSTMATSRNRETIVLDIDGGSAHRRNGGLARGAPVGYVYV